MTVDERFDQLERMVKRLERDLLEQAQKATQHEHPLAQHLHQTAMSGAPPHLHNTGTPLPVFQQRGGQPVFG